MTTDIPVYTETREAKSPKKDEKLVQATVQKLVLNPCSESYSCLGHYSSVNISQRGIYPLCSTQV